MKKMRIGVLFGGRSGEHEVSLMSARSVLSAIDPEKYEVTMIGITKQGRWIGGDDPLLALESGAEAAGEAPVAALLGDPLNHALLQLREDERTREMACSNVAELDIVFPVLHGTFGEDGTVQGLFELADMAYVGAGVVGSAVGMDKSVFKAVMRAAGLPVLPAVVFNRSEYERNPDAVIRRVVRELKYPIFVKPVNLGSSVGVTKAADAATLRAGIDEAARWDRRLLVEQGMDAREIEVSVLGNDEPQASIAGEILPQREFYDYEAKYISDDSKLLIPAPITAAQLEQVQVLAVDAFKAVDCAGMARVDFLLDKSSGELWLNELNTIPGFTSISMYPKLWQASGLEYPELIDRLIELALERKAQRDNMKRSFEVKH
ncbi:MAG TPA: D-alanine--D-alanine ligase family protein [Anaerolineales bacterium]|jgi:D-alanine-D-alanine ligase|nr:D-alanine--D-alanine ligase family protein [Anaerolineales bacterium]HJN41045.1 D-alanine--D-alanine ligase family protein [Anaerolineales bacterium]